MNIISPFADQTVVQDILSGSPELERFAFEFCKEFNCQLEQTIERKRSRLRPTLNLLTPDGLPVGSLAVDTTGERDADGKHIPVYFYDSPAVKKSKGSARAGRSCRDSKNIKALITAVKRNNETPSTQSLVASYANGIMYALNSINTKQRAAQISVSTEELLALILSHLEVDKSAIRVYDDSIKEKYKQYLISQEKYVDVQTTAKRFCEGSYLIGWMQRDYDEPIYYVVSEISATSIGGDLIYHTPLKRYKTLMDCPEIAPHVPIIAAWASGLPNKVDDNELKLPRNDAYYDEIDVASGYATRSEMWFLIPKKPA